MESLPQKQFNSGLIEAVKMFMTSDADSFLFVEKNIDKLLKRNQQVIKNVVTSAIQIKARIVERDERESGERMILNLGHTIGQAFEELSQYKILHGYAVALGIIVEAGLAVDIGKLKESDYLRIERFMVNKIGIDLKYLRAYKPAEILNHTKNDKKTKNEKPHFVVLKEIGKAHSQKNIFAFPVPDTTVVRVLDNYYKL